jgi:recombination protein RecT
MCEKTVINKACKYVINSSSDSNIVTKFAKETDTASVEAEVEEEIETKANKEIINIESGEIIDIEPAVENEPEKDVNEGEPY